MKKINIEIPDTSIIPSSPFEVVLCHNKGVWLVFDQRDERYLPLKENLIWALVFFDVNYEAFHAILKNAIEQAVESQEVISTFPFEEVIIYGLSEGYRRPGGGGEGYSWLALDWIGRGGFPITEEIQKILEKLIMLCKNERFDLVAKIKAIREESSPISGMTGKRTSKDAKK